MKKILETKDSLLTIKYAPSGEVINENPPRFTWMPASDEDLEYRLQLSKSPDFTEDTTETFENIPYNFFTLDHILEPGTYYWRYSLNDKAYDYSQERNFSVTKDLIQTPLISREHRYDNATLTHPRIWLDKDGIKNFRENHKKDKNYCGFDTFYQKSILTYLDKEFIKEPKPYPDNKRVVHLWRQNYTDCQEALTHIRSLAVGGVILEDERMISGAKAALLEIAGWDTKGPTNRDYNDECAFRVAYALAFGYDWLYDYLTKEERDYVFEKLFIRTKQVADHVIVNSRIHFSLYDSHAVRSLSSVLTPCCIAMLTDCEEAREWLDYTIEYFNVIYTPWGGVDGGWAEGPMYWTTGMAFVIDAMNMIKNFTGIDIYKRPFFQKTGDFPLYCNPVDTYRASFCDQSNLGKYPGHKLAFNIRQFALVSKNENYRWFYDEVFKREPEIEQAFYNNGWWDFHFDEMVYQHDSKDIILEKQELTMVKWFHDIGWVAINKDMKDFDNHIFMLTKSSPYGSVSHSHGDQNSFLLFAYGEPFIIKSGYYVGFNTSMHRDWRRQTKSHNTILIDGKGQYAGMDKAKQLNAKGCVCEVKEEENLVYIKENATKAYLENVPELIDYTREIYFIDKSYFVIVDSIEAEHEVAVDWLLHSLTEFKIDQNKFSIQRSKASLDGKVVYCSSQMESFTQTNEFEGVDEKEIEGLEPQWHLTMKTKKAKNHVIVSLLVPSKMELPSRDEERKIVSAIKDDQGHDVFIYFSHEGNTFSLRTDGNKRY